MLEWQRHIEKMLIKVKSGPDPLLTPCRHVQNGQKLRVLSALSKGNEIVIKPRTEIYHFDIVVD